MLLPRNKGKALPSRIPEPPYEYDGKGEEKGEDEDDPHPMGDVDCVCGGFVGYEVCAADRL